MASTASNKIFKIILERVLELKMWAKTLKPRFHRTKLYLGLCLVCLALSYLRWNSLSGPQTKASESFSSIDQLIPDGSVLIPIEIEYYEFLDSVLGNYGIVDLYESSNIRQALVKSIKLIRSPENPSQFAVLAPATKAALILSRKGPFRIAIRNQRQSGTVFVKQKENKRFKIIYTEEETK